MKSIFYLLLIASSLAFVGCGKDDDNNIVSDFEFVHYWKGTQEGGNAEASVMGKNWEASAYAFPDMNQPDYLSILIETYTDNGLLRDQIQFGNFSKTVGEYTVVQDPTAEAFDDFIIYGYYTQFSDDGDVIFSSYKLDSTFENTINIDMVDTINHIMEGRFDLLFEIVENGHEKELPKEVFFENGKFKVKI
jgi:hypothetical protein